MPNPTGDVRATVSRQLTARRLALRREPTGRRTSLACRCGATLWRLEADPVALQVVAACFACGATTRLDVPRP